MSTLKGQILITDDDPEMRWVLGTALGALGFGVVSSSNGEQALIEIQARRFDAVLLDVGLPKMSGLDVLERLRTKRSQPKVLVMTADETPETVILDLSTL